LMDLFADKIMTPAKELFLEFSSQQR